MHAGFRNFDTTPVFGHLVLVPASVLPISSSPRRGSRQRLVLADAGNITRQSGGGSSCNRIRMSVMRVGGTAGMNSSMTADGRRKRGCT